MSGLGQGLVVGLGRMPFVWATPFAHDQFDNARRSQRFGLGLTMSRDRYTAASATRTLHRLLSNPDISRRATQFGRLIRAEDGIEAACEEVGRVFAT